MLDRFRVECLSTTDATDASLETTGARRNGAALHLRPTFRPDAVVTLGAVGGGTRWPSSAGRRPRDDQYAAYIAALAQRRAAFKELGALATDQAACRRRTPND